MNIPRERLRNAVVTIYFEWYTTPYVTLSVLARSAFSEDRLPRRRHSPRVVSTRKESARRRRDVSYLRHFLAS